MCSVVINLLRSPELNPIRCAITLRHFGRTRNGYVATHFTLFSSTAESSATSGYVVLPERFRQNAEPASRSAKQTRKKPSFAPRSGFKLCNMQAHVNMNFFIIFMYLFFVFYWALVHFLVLSSYGKSLWSFLYVNLFCVSVARNTLISSSNGLDSYIFR